MRNQFDRELDILNNELIRMGSLIETVIEDAISSLVNKDSELAKSVSLKEEEVNAMEKSIESRCLQLLLRQQPVAGDLRLISSILKIITDLERIGDQAEDIAEISLLLMDEKLIKELTHIPQMGTAVIKMLNDSIDAFVNKNEEAAYEVIAFDDVVDDLFDVVKDELISYVNHDIDNGEQAINLIMIAKYLERIGDHAQNIAEWVLFAITGKHVNGKNV